MAVDAFIKLGDIKGESTDKEHKDEIDILAWSWGVSQSGSTHLGSGGGSGKANVQDFSFTHHVDSASPNLIHACCKGKHISEATIVMRKAGGDSAVPYLTIKLKDILISSVSAGGSQGEERLTETVGLNFAEFEYSYQPQGKDGAKKGGAITTKFNVPENA